MAGRKRLGVLIAFVCSVSLVASSVTAILTAKYYNRIQFQLLGSVCQRIVDEQPQSEATVLAVLKSHKNSLMDTSETNILSDFGYREPDFLLPTQKSIVIFALIGFLSGNLLLLFAIWHRHRRDTLRIKALTDYLEQINMGGSGLLLQSEDDHFSKLQDEIYKTVTFAYQTRDAAMEAKHNFAENLSNIAHQLKTPITAISLSTQMIKESSAKTYVNQIKKQLVRLTHLEEALLLLSRLDAGTLPLKLEMIDVFTVLSLSSDNLRELFSAAGISVDIPESGEMGMKADLDWTMEAIMNLMKNCMEHTPRGGTVHCSYEQNPIYTQIQIWDEGQGFAKEDIPHLFERFYRGKNGSEGGIGIGLSLAKAIVEAENGIIYAKNLPGGGACFEIRIYSH